MDDMISWGTGDSLIAVQTNLNVSIFLTHLDEFRWLVEIKYRFKCINSADV